MVQEHSLLAAELASISPLTVLSGRILLAEDGADNQLLITTILSRHGLEVDVAENGEVAVEPEDAVSSAKSGAQDLLYSHYADDPDMEELVAEFVERLPVRLEALSAAWEGSDLHQVERLAHQLKGVAGGYGFQPVSDEAARLESAVRDAQPVSEISAQLKTLADTCYRVRSGKAE